MHVRALARSAGVVLGMLVCRAISMPAQEPSAPRTQEKRAPAAAEVRPLDRPVTLRLRQARLEDALAEVDRQAQLGLSYTPRVVPIDRRVSINVEKVPAGKALELLLDGTGARATETSNGTVMLERRSESVVPSAGGTIGGVVRDSGSQRPLSGAQVLIDHTSLSAVTNDSGVYWIQGVPVGPQTLMVRLIGYTPVVQVVTVIDSQSVRADFLMAARPTRLSEVVTTATGQRRRVELGNDITILNADSIVATQPVSSVTELLATRVPGLMLLHSSGAPGDPARLRLRGASSITGSNDPIIIVDGVRIYYAQSAARNANLAPGAVSSELNSPPPAPSPLDQIDPNSVQTIEVFKGPSAATMYGPDAANGVIVITTKKGRPGPARWTASVRRGTTSIPGRYPEGYLLWGHSLYASQPGRCTLADAGFSCVVDSLTRFQALNEAATTMLGRGNETGVTLGVSGGGNALTYSLTGSVDDELGVVKLPALSAERFQLAHGVEAPDWMSRPQRLRRWSVTSGLTAQLGQKAELGVSAMVARDRQQRSSLEGQLGRLMGVYVDRTTGEYYEGALGTPMPDLLTGYYTRATAGSTHFTNAVRLTWRPLGWLTADADAGLDVITRQDEAFLPRGLSTADDSVGFIGRGDGNTLVKTVNLRAMITAPLPLGFRLQTGIGANYTSTAIADVQTMGRDILAGTASIAGAKSRDVTETRNDLASFGWYVEPTIAHKRVWLSTGLRLDGGNTYGSGVSLARFPKVSLSYLVSDEPWFPGALKSVFNTLRLRGAYGHSGVQPGVGNVLRLYRQQARWFDGQIVDVVQIQSLGNTQLKPERSSELEGGFDADLLGDRLSVGITGYRKTKEDAILPVPVAPSVYGSATIERNIGTVRNTGFEVSLSTQLVRSDPITWNAVLYITRNRNRVLSLNGGEATPLNTYQRVVAGYPLFGYWTRPILGYADANGDGIIQSGEVLLADSVAFMGAAAEPKYEGNLHMNVGLLRGAITIGGGLSYQNGLSQLNQALLQSPVLLRGMHDPSAPLSEQAATAVLGLGTGQTTSYGLFQTLSVLRLTSLSVAYNVPPSTARWFGARAMNVALQGTNLGLWTSYRGKDPDVNGFGAGNQVGDTGVLPQPRTWQLRVNVSY